jgi:hypothetical protein
MTDLGVRYLMVRTPEAQSEAAAQPELELIASSGPWEIYELATARIVEPLTVQPIVVEERGGDQRERNLEVGTSWFQRQQDWAAMPADDGPDEWQRVPVEIDLGARVGEPGDRSRDVDYVVPSEAIDVVELDPVTVSAVDVQQQSISFEVDQVGVPVLVRVSYFPTWKVDGAEGPYRVAPNFMVVIPTENQVTLSYSKTPLDWFFYSLTAIGIGLCVFWRRRGDMVYPSERPGRWLAPTSVGPIEIESSPVESERLEPERIEPGPVESERMESPVESERIEPSADEPTGTDAPATVESPATHDR